MSNDKLRKLFPQGPNYRENKTISFKKRKKIYERWAPISSLSSKCNLTQNAFTVPSQHFQVQS